MLARRRRSWVLAAFVLAIAGVAWLAMPLSPRGLESHPDPAPDYASALIRVEALRAADTPEISSECGTELFTHGARTGREIVLLHGLTNCPAQFDSLARMLYARGANVLVPRLPRHGRSDRMTDDLARSDARELCTLTDRAIDAARGLGDSVTVVGLSIGGVMAAWAGQMRMDVDRAVPIAPLIGAKMIPATATAAVTRLTLVLPNRFVWWDSKRRGELAGPRHVYPRFSTRSIAASMRIGGATLARARKAAPGARSLAMVTVGGDEAVSNEACEALVQSWRDRGSRDVVSFEFPIELGLNHDVVDPEQVGGNPAITYPRLIELIDP